MHATAHFIALQQTRTLGARFECTVRPLSASGHLYHATGRAGSASRTQQDMYKQGMAHHAQRTAAASLGPISPNALYASRSLPPAPCAGRPRALSQTRRPARPAWRSRAGCRPRSRGQRASRAGAAHMHHTRCRAAVCGQRGGAMRLLLARTRAGRLLEARCRLRPAAERSAATALVADTALAAARAGHAGQDNTTPPSSRLATHWIPRTLEGRAWARTDTYCRSAPSSSMPPFSARVAMQASTTCRRRAFAC